MSRSAVAVTCLSLLLIPITWSQQPPSTNAPAGSSATTTARQMTELRADIMMAKKMYSDAILGYEALLRQEPSNAVLLNKLGVAYQEMGNLGRAEHYYKKAAKADKTYANPLNNIGTVEYARQHFGKAIHWYLRTLKVQPDMATAYSNLGYAYFGEKKYAQAMLAFEKALALDPTVFEHQGGFGSVMEDRSVADPGLFYYLVAKTYAATGDAFHTALYLKMARDDGYKNYILAKKDPAFAPVIKDPRVQEIFLPVKVLARSPR